MEKEPNLVKGATPQRGFSRIATFIYVAALLVTIAIVLLAGLPSNRTGHMWTTLTALIFGESFLYGIALHYLSGGSRSRKLFPAYLGMGIVAGLYLVVAVLFVLIFSWGLDVSAFSYALLQFIALGVAAIAIGLMAIYLKNAERQEKGT